MNCTSRKDDFFCAFLGGGSVEGRRGGLGGHPRVEGRMLTSIELRAAPYVPFYNCVHTRSGGDKQGNFPRPALLNRGCNAKPANYSSLTNQRRAIAMIGQKYKHFLKPHSHSF